MDAKTPLTAKIKSFMVQSKRVWHVLKKPSKLEFTTVAKVSAIGILIIGALGFIISDAVRLFIRFFG